MLKYSPVVVEMNQTKKGKYKTHTNKSQLKMNNVYQFRQDYLNHIVVLSSNQLEIPSQPVQQ